MTFGEPVWNVIISGVIVPLLLWLLKRAGKLIKKISTFDERITKLEQTIAKMDKKRDGQIIQLYKMLATAEKRDDERDQI